MKIKLDGEWLEVEDVRDYGSLPLLELEDGREFYVAESREVAGEKAREYWEDMAQDDPEEFACIVGEKTLVAWALGQNAGPGSIGVNSLEEWLDLHLDIPEEHFAGYDGMEVEVEGADGELIEELGFDEPEDWKESPWVVYRQN